MTSLLSHEAFHESVGHSFDELLMLDQMSRLPAESIARVLQSIPEPLLQQAMASRQGAAAGGARPRAGAAGSQAHPG